MSEETAITTIEPFFNQSGVELIEIPVGEGVPLGIQQVTNPQIGIGGAYGTWGEGYDNQALPALIEHRLGAPLQEQDRITLSPLGFDYRHHIAELSPQEHLEVELAVGEYFLRQAAQACGWEPGEVEGVLIGNSGPVADDYTVQIARRAGIPESAWKVSMHKACDGSVGSLHMALNPGLEIYNGLGINLARELEGKKVLVGGIEGLSRFVEFSQDANAMQLFGNGAGVIGVIPGETMQFLVGKTHEVFDEDGVLAVHMYYPHSGQRHMDQTNVETSLAGARHIRVAGLMNEPADGRPVVMAGPMGMVKLFVRTGVVVVSDLYRSYRELMSNRGTPEKEIDMVVVHHANYKINKLLEKQLQGSGINLEMPWVLSEFGNVSAASNMIAFLRQLPGMKPGDHILIDGFGAGTYYDVLVVALGE
jgi:3-oxoacyl-[acyl-carrier-protein] synthase III